MVIRLEAKTDPDLADLGPLVCRPEDQEKFLDFFLKLFMPGIVVFHSRLDFIPSSVDWWASGVVRLEDSMAPINFMFHQVHLEVP
jgi:hypothetical protein